MRCSEINSSAVLTKMTFLIFMNWCNQIDRIRCLPISFPHMQQYHILPFTWLLLPYRICTAKRWHALHLLLYSNSLEFEMFVGVRSYTNVCHTFSFFMNWYNHIAYRRKWTNINKRTAKQECWKFYKNNMSANAVTWDKLVVLHVPLTLLL